EPSGKSPESAVSSVPVLMSETSPCTDTGPSPGSSGSNASRITSRGRGNTTRCVVIVRCSTRLLESDQAEVLDGQQLGQGGQDVTAAAGVDRQGELRLDVAERDAHVISLAADLGSHVGLPAAEKLLRIRQLDLAPLADIVTDVVLDAVEDRGREDVDAEEAE